MLTQLNRLKSDGTEACFYIDTTRPLIPEELKKIFWVVAETFEPKNTSTTSFLQAPHVEIGPHLSVETPFSSNAVSICKAMGLDSVKRLECSIRYPITASTSAEEIIEANRDRMTQSVYETPLISFDEDKQPNLVRSIPILEEGKEALRKLNSQLGLGMDAWDITYYTEMFKKLGRNPTDVECFQIGNANSEHCRHWFFRGKIIINGEEMPQTLIDLIRMPLLALGQRHNSILAFNDNAGAIRGHMVGDFVPSIPGEPSPMVVRRATLHITGTAETHNHPTMIAPFPGAATGTGGRIRDNSAAGKGSTPLAGAVGYAVGDLHIPGHIIPGETILGEGEVRKLPFSSPLEILVKGSNGASAYGNEFGEPVITGFLRTGGLDVGGERREYLKPILYSGGVGRMKAEHIVKEVPKEGMVIVRIGGPAYRIGVGGGAASSMTQGSNSAELDRQSVQRGNGEMGNKVNRVLRTCVEMGENTPVRAIHDQGAGGPSNVLTELMAPIGGRVDIRKINLGDRTMSVLEIWSAEFQEGYGLLIDRKRLAEFQRICDRERVNCEVMGEVTGDGMVRVDDSSNGTTPVNLSLDAILGKLPQKTFSFERPEINLPPLKLPEGLTVKEALDKVFLLPQVGSKGFLVHKVDRSVTGLIAAQQTCGPAQIAVGDVAVTADGYFDNTGAAMTLGENSNRILVDSKAGSRMALGEMITNMAGTLLGAFDDIKCRVNWMWPAKLPGEGALIYDAAKSLSHAMIELGIAADGGKDSSSMAANVEGKRVKSPGQVVFLGYAPVEDVNKTVTPDFKHPGEGFIGYIDLGNGKNRMGGSSLAQAYGQVGNESPDLDNAQELKKAVIAIQEMIREGVIHSLHDRSDGGMITSLAEMSMSGLAGARIDIPCGADPIKTLFNEELGFFFEYLPRDAVKIGEIAASHGIDTKLVGTVTNDDKFVIQQAGKVLLDTTIIELRKQWEKTSSKLESLQSNPKTAEAEKARFSDTRSPNYSLTYEPLPTPSELLGAPNNPKVAVIREEGTNGDREMAAAMYMAGLNPTVLSMSDLLGGAKLDGYRGVVFPGGFSFMDVFDSAKGWAGVIRINDKLREEFAGFFDRPDTFSLGVCNGCQLMALLGRVPFDGTPEVEQPRFIHNDSHKFESRWVQVSIPEDNPSILFKDMGGSSLGVWVAHGEGKLVFPDNKIHEEVKEQNLVPLVYATPDGAPTIQYPYNPNGSRDGYAGLCSKDGRHTATMPHPERCVSLYNWPWMPQKWRSSMQASPWLKMFQNARQWCVENPR